MQLHIKSPVLFSKKLENLYNKQIYFKLDAVQPTGSFKIRGIGKLCQSHKEKGAKKLVSSSGGNAGVAAAYAGCKLGMPVTVIVPESSHQIFIEKIKSYGAKVKVFGESWDEANKLALEIAKDKETDYVPPFDHPLIWQGNATVITELAKEIPKPDAVLVAVGGGGLACGVLEGLHSCGWDDTVLVTVETKGADSFYQAILANKRVALEKVTSKATSLGAKKVCKHLFGWREKHKIIPRVVSDEYAQKGSLEFAKDQRVLTEISSGAALSLVYQNDLILKEYKTILVIVCGGLNITWASL